jgi:hypothetical protein
LPFVVLAPLLVVACLPAMPGGKPSSAGGAAADDCSPVQLDRKTFPEIPKIDNKFRPLVPGMQFVLDGFVIGIDGSRHPHQIETTVTELTKLIDGVNTIVIFERDFHDSQMTESELFFVAQDTGGSVWNLGEYPEVYDSGHLLGAPSAWLSGAAGARAGIEMPGKPRVGGPPFSEGLAPEVRFKDCGVVFKTDQRACVRGTCYDGVLVVDEFAPLNRREGHQRKYYAPGVGTVKVGAAGGVDPEELELSKASKLCQAGFAELQALALAQDGRAYQDAKSIYGTYQPAKKTLNAQLCAA